MVAQTAEFKKAIEDSRKLKAKPSDDELLQVRRPAALKHDEVTRD
jgi:acyl-CoA-binding protein